MHGARQGVGQGLVDRLVDRPVVAELDLALLGVHIDVDLIRRHADIQDGKGKAPLGNLGLVGMLDGL